MNIIEFADKDQLGKAAAAFIARTIESKQMRFSVWQLAVHQLTLIKS